MVAVMRHGDRTPKQKMKMVVTQERWVVWDCFFSIMDTLPNHVCVYSKFICVCSFKSLPATLKVILGIITHVIFCVTLLALLN